MKEYAFCVKALSSQLLIILLFYAILLTKINGIQLKQDVIWQKVIVGTIYINDAAVVELVDTLSSGGSGFIHVSSSLISCTK